MLTYLHKDAAAFLDDAQGHEQVYDGILLCDIHATRFSAPRGWTTTDRRDASTRHPSVSDAS